MAAQVRIGVVGHVLRREQAETLAESVGADVLWIDDGTLGCEGNHRRVQVDLSELPSSWSVILEDDALPVPGFREQLADALIHAPTPIVSLYLGKMKPAHWQQRIKTALHHAAKEGASWIVSSHLIHAVGYAIKTDLLPSLLKHPTELPADQHIGHFARSYGHLVSYATPSLVDHADLPTTVTHSDGPRRPGRKAWTVGPREQWTSQAVTMR